MSIACTRRMQYRCSHFLDEFECFGAHRLFRVLQQLDDEIVDQLPVVEEKKRTEQIDGSAGQGKRENSHAKSGKGNERERTGEKERGGGRERERER